MENSVDQYAIAGIETYVRIRNQYFHEPGGSGWQRADLTSLPPDLAWKSLTARLREDYEATLLQNKLL